MHTMSDLAESTRRRWSRLRRGGDAGYSTEWTVVTALVVAGALVVVGLIVAQVIAKAESIDLGMLW